MTIPKRTFNVGDPCGRCTSTISSRGGHLQCNNCGWMAPSNTASAAVEVPGAKEVERSTPPYSADNGDSKSVAALDRSRAHAALSNDLLSQWLSALRSGLYRQARGRLHDTADDSYCCLGVLQAEAQKCGINLRNADLTYHLATGDAQNAVGLTYQQQRRLATENDHGAPFTEIADLIEREMVSPGYGFAMFRKAALTALERTP